MRDLIIASIRANAYIVYPSRDDLQFWRKPKNFIERIHRQNSWRIEQLQANKIPFNFETDFNLLDDAQLLRLYNEIMKKQWSGMTKTFEPERIELMPFAPVEHDNEWFVEFAVYDPKDNFYGFPDLTEVAVWAIDNVSDWRVEGMTFMAFSQQEDAMLAYLRFT